MMKTFKRRLAMALTLLMLLCTLPLVSQAADGHIHDYAETDVSWADDYSKVIVTYTCRSDPSHTATIEAAAEWTGTSPDCIQEGYTYHYAYIDFEGEEYYYSTEVTVPPTGHVSPPKDEYYRTEEHPHEREYVCTKCGDIVTLYGDYGFSGDCGICLPKVMDISSQYIVKVAYKSDISALELKVFAYMRADSSDVDITDKITVEGFDTSSTGDKTATVIYYDEYGNKFTDEINYTVKYTFLQILIRILLLGFIWY